jgi:hypothetical protein
MLSRATLGDYEYAGRRGTAIVGDKNPHPPPLGAKSHINIGRAYTEKYLARSTEQLFLPYFE